MKRKVTNVLLGVAWLVLVAAAAGAEELTIDSILTMHRSGAPADIIVARVDSPANTLAMTTGVATCQAKGLDQPGAREQEMGKESTVQKGVLMYDAAAGIVIGNFALEDAGSGAVLRCGRGKARPGASDGQRTPPRSRPVHRNLIS